MTDSLVPPASAGDTPLASSVYIRSRGSIEKTIRWIEREAERIHATDVIVAFDAATFDPPPGLTEFTLDYGFFDDLDEWIEALGEWAARARPMVRGTSSLLPKTVDMKRWDARESLAKLVRSSWWEGERPASLPPASNWMKEAFARTESAVRAKNARPVRMLVLVAGRVTPERWIRGDAVRATFESEWRTKLARIGTYFRSGDVAAAVSRAGGHLYVIAPEARFGEFTPIVEMPELPWAARPGLPISPGPRATRPVPPRRLRRGRAGLGRRELDELLAPVIPDPEERRKAVDAMLRAASTPTTPGGLSPVPGIRQTNTGGLRYKPTTPVWFPMSGYRVPCNNHAPSGYGYWPYARAAAATGGRYIFYPFPDRPWLDVCPRDGNLLDDLAPELVSRSAYLAARRSDPALAALARATAIVIDETPWADTDFGHRAARSWSSILRTSPLQIERKVWMRIRPYDNALQDSERGMERLGRRLQEEVLPRYDKAIAVIENALSTCVPGQGGVHARSHANLLLARYWFHMSAFHLAAYAIYAREIQRFIPDEMKGHVDRIVVTYVPTIRLSDCLDAYDGRELRLAEESRYDRWVPPSAPGYQGNLLRIPADHADYRARRNLASVLRFLDKRLRRRALRMIDAARGVMRRYARTGWGWSTYYSDAYTFIFKPIPVARGHRPVHGGGKPPPRPTTPEGGGEGKGGSNPGGPATGGK